MHKQKIEAYGNGEQERHLLHIDQIMFEMNLQNFHENLNYIFYSVQIRYWIFQLYLILLESDLAEFYEFLLS